jgi:ferric-dicitrate binding protein FerR (iron transport regulator)
MECRDFEEKFSQSLDNLLPVDDVEKLRQHRESCRTCRSCAEWYDTVRTLLDKEEQIEVPDGFTGMVMARIDALPAYKPSPVRELFRSYGVGLAMAASFGAMLLLTNPWKESDQSVALRPVANNEVAWQAGSASTVETADIKLASLRGEVQVLRQNAFQWRNAGEDFTLGYNDKIRTLSGSSAQLVYADGTQVQLGDNSLVQLQPNALRVFHGDSWIHVTKKGTAFEAVTPNLVASVRGTIYAVGVRFDQKPYMEFLEEMSRKENHLMTISPELYFRDFSLDTLVEIGNRESWTKVDSQVSVFESSVYVEPNSTSFEAAQGVVLSEGFKLNYTGETAVASLPQEKLTREDYLAWRMDVPSHLVQASEGSSVSSQPEAGVEAVRTEGSVAQPVEGSVRSSNSTAEQSPEESFLQLNKQ